MLAGCQAEPIDASSGAPWDRGADSPSPNRWRSIELAAAVYLHAKMKVRWIRRIAFGGAGMGMFWLAAQSYARVGLASDTAVPAAIGLVMITLAITAQGG